MTIHRLTPIRIALSLLPALGVFGVVQTAAAEECGDVTCDVGFVCNTYDYGGEEPSYSCDRASCESDADCGEYMVCGTFETFCGDLLISCAEGEDCAQPADEDCEAGEFKQCAARWELPCEAAADCGEGFTCETDEYCAEYSADEPAEGEEPACNEMAEYSYCLQEQIACDADADCPPDWTCVEQWGTCDDEGNCTEDMALMCQPPYDKVWGPTSGDPGIILAAGAAEDGAPIAEDGAVDEDTAAPQGEVATLGDPEAVEETDEAAEEDRPARGDNVGGDADEPEVIEDEGSGNDVEQMANAGDPSASEGGCSVGSKPAPGAGLGFLALGLAALLTGRRRKAA